MSQATNPWNEIFKERGRVFLDPHEDIPKIAAMLEERGAKRLLDLGSGTGRHVVFFARRGMTVWGLDNSPEGLRATRAWLADEGLKATLVDQSMLDPLPFEDEFFDAVISVQVIHHARLATIRSVVREVQRVLKPGGLLFVTVPQIRNQATEFEEIEPNTYIPLNGSEKGLAHHYFTPEELTEVFAGVEVTTIRVDSVRHYSLEGWKR